MNKLIGKLDYPKHENLFQVDYSILYSNHEYNTLWFRLINNTTKAVIAYRIKIYFMDGSDEKVETIERRNLCLSIGGYSEEHSILLPSSTEEGHIVVDIVLFEDLESQKNMSEIPFASYDVISKKVNKILLEDNYSYANDEEVDERSNYESTSVAPKEPVRENVTVTKASPEKQAKIDKLKKKYYKENLKRVNKNSELEKRKRKIAVISSSIIIGLLVMVFGIIPFIAVLFGNYSIYINMYKISEFSIPEKTEIIKEEAFKDCQSLRKVIIPDSVIRIENHAFANCNNLNLVTLPENLEYIGDRAFYNCHSITSLTIPNTVEYVGRDILENCNSIISLSVPFLGATENAGGDYIGYFFGKNVNLHNNPLPNSLKIIKITKSTTIDDYAFYCCSTLETIILHEDTSSIGQSAFEGCKSITELTIPKKVSSIGERAFSECLNLNTLTLPNVINQNGDDTTLYYLFGSYLHDNLKRIILTNATSIGEYAFSGWPNLTEIILPANLTTIGDYAFSGCSKLNEIDIPNSVTSIGSAAFASCNNLYNIVIPNSVNHIGESVFLKCYSLESITIPFIGGNVSENGTLNYLFDFDGFESVPSSLKTVTITRDETIDEFAFYLCSNLEKVVLPQNLRSIGTFAFYGCKKLDSITIPENVVFIGDNSFRDTAIQKVYFEGTYGQWMLIEKGNNAFSNNVSIICKK